MPDGNPDSLCQLSKLQYKLLSTDSLCRSFNYKLLITGKKQRIKNSINKVLETNRYEQECY